MIDKNQNFRKLLLKFLICIFSISYFNFCVYADDIEAKAEIEKAKAQFVKGDYLDAAESYMGAKLLADSPGIKFKALEKASQAFGKGEQKYKQFKCLKELVEGFPDRIDFEKIITTEYKIGNDFEKGHRDISLSWLPWIKGENKASEIYESLVDQAPFAPFAPKLKLKLGRMYLKEGKNKKALQAFRVLIRQHPKTKEAKYARFELANGLVQLATKAGDGDGSYSREADVVLEKTLKIYPKDPETTWIKESIKETDDVRAKRLYNLAAFYKSRKNPEAATRYFNDLIARYPESKLVEAAEKQLIELDKNYKPKAKNNEKKSKYPYPALKMKDESNVILIAPEASGGKWLLPIEDLDLDSANADAEYKAKKEAEAEARRKAEEKRKAEIAARKAEKERVEAARKAKEKAEEAERLKKQKEKEAKIRKAAEEKTRKIKEEAERLVKEKLKADTKAEEERKKKEDAAKAEEEKKKKEDAAKAEEEIKKKEIKKSEEGKNKKEAESAKVKTEKVKNSPSEKKESSKITTYLVIIVLIILAIVGGIIYFGKKKKQV